MKKIFAIGLSFLLCFSFVSTVFAAEEQTPVQAFVSDAQAVQHSDPAALGALGKMAVRLFDEVTPYAENVTVETEDDNDALTNLLLQVYDQAGATVVDLPALPEGPMAAPKRTDSADGLPEGSGRTR